MIGQVYFFALNIISVFNRHVGDIATLNNTLCSPLLSVLTNTTLLSGSPPPLLGGLEARVSWEELVGEYIREGDEDFS